MTMETQIRTRSVVMLLVEEEGEVTAPEGTMCSVSPISDDISEEQFKRVFSNLGDMAYEQMFNEDTQEVAQ